MAWADARLKQQHHRINDPPKVYTFAQGEVKFRSSSILPQAMILKSFFYNLMLRPDQGRFLAIAADKYASPDTWKHADEIVEKTKMDCKIVWAYSFWNCKSFLDLDKWICISICFFHRDNFVIQDMHSFFTMEYEFDTWVWNTICGLFHFWSLFYSFENLLS